MRVCYICGTYHDNGREITCSNECHNKLVERLLNTFGEFKRVVSMRSNIAYKVPTKDIIEKGIKEEDLDKYPIWREEK